METKKTIKSAFAVLITLMLIVLVMQFDIPSSETRGESSVIQAYPIGTVTPTPPSFTPGPWPTASPPGVTATPIPVSPTPTPPLSDRAQQALRYVSQTYTVPIEDLMFLIEAVGNYPLTGRTIWQGKILDRASHRVYVVGIDEAGQIVDPETIKQAEEDAAFQQYGKLEPALYDRLQTLDEEDRVKASIWLSGVDEQQIMNQIAAKYPWAKLIGPRPSKETDMADYEKIEAEMMEAKRQAYLAVEEPIIAFLEARGFSVIYASRAAPLIFAELPKRMILELADRTDVSAIYLSKPAHLTLDSAIPTDRVQLVWERGITGSSYRVAVIENNGVDFGHDALVDGLYYNPDDPNIWGEQGHATWVAGAIASTDETHRGVAYGGPGLLSANASSFEISDIIAATEWAIGEGPNTLGEYLSPSDKAQVLNNSWAQNSYGTIDAYARYYDHVVYHHFRTVVAGTGNDGTWVKSPALAYNVIGVGGIDDNNTSSWSDDQMWSLSDYENPGAPWSDREKPEVVAVGVDVTTTHPGNGWATVSGTSVAAPQVSGLASLLIQRKDMFRLWPEGIKAIIMASAVHPIETPSVPIPGDGIDDRDGAGAIDAALADTITKNEWWRADIIFPPPPANAYYKFEALAGEKVRVVIVWPSHPDNNHPPSTDPLKSNLDLFIYKPDDPYTPIAYSVSNENNYEIVEFTAPKTGEYTIEVAKITFEDTVEYLTVAWVRTGTYLPDIKGNYNGWTSELVIRNNGATSRDISTHVIDHNGSFVNDHECPDVPSNGTCSFSASDAVNNFDGSAIVDGSEDLSVVVKQRHNNKTYAYSGFPGSSVFGFTPGTPIYLPNSFYDYYGWYSHATVQNAGTNTAQVRAEYYNQSGQEIYSETKYIAPCASKEFGPAGSSTSAIKLTSINGQPIVATLTQYDAQSIEQSTRTSGYIGFSVGGNDVYLPGLYKNYYGWTSAFRVQNLGSSEASLTIKYYDQYGNNPYTEQPTPVAPHGWREFYQGDDPGPSSFSRSAWINSTQPIVAVANQETSSDHQSYSGFISGARTIHLPLVQKNYNGWVTGIHVQNTSENEVDVTIDFYYANGGSAGSTGPWTIAAYASQVFYNEIPNGLNGSAVVTADGDVVVIVNQNNYGISDGALSYSGLD